MTGNEFSVQSLQRKLSDAVCRLNLLKNDKHKENGDESKIA